MFFKNSITDMKGGEQIVRKFSLFPRQCVASGKATSHTSAKNRLKLADQYPVLTL
jgi:hypothetical protein